MMSSILFLLVLLCALVLLTAGFSFDKTGELYLRIRTWLIIVVVLLVATLCAPWGWYGLFGVLLMLSWTELRHIQRDQTGQCEHGFDGLFNWVFLWVSVALVCLAGIVMMFPVMVGTALVLYFFFAVQANDVLQYVFGKLCGRHPLARTLSPNKTIEGAVLGSIASAGLSSLLAGWLVPMVLPQVFLLGLILAVAGTFGDLMISGFKRRRRIKDMGTLLPGHGGLLDRIDSLLLSAPLFFMLLWLLLHSA